MTYDVFISYSRKDTIIADRICAAFDKAGISYFIDRQDIAGGMEFPKVLAPAIKESEVFLLLASENAYQSPFTTREVLYAFNKKRGEKMLPYIIDGSVLPDDIEFVFSATNWRTIKEHPIEPVLVNDILQLLGRSLPPIHHSSEEKNLQPIHHATIKKEKRDNKKTLSRVRLVKKDTIEKVRHYIFAFPIFAFPVAFVVLFIVTLPANKKYSQEELVEIVAIGDSLSEIKHFEKALKYYSKAAKHGNAMAQYKLGVMYDEGQGTPRNCANAMRWLRESAEQGNAEAETYIGYMYKWGRCVKCDSVEAAQWYRKAAEQGYVKAQYYLGRMYDNGVCVAQDSSEALFWYRKAAEQGHAEAQYTLGRKHYNPDNPIRGRKGEYNNPDSAVFWYRTAAVQGHVWAQYYLGKMYYNGDGVAQNSDSALFWYRKAAAKGFQSAINEMERITEGQNTPSSKRTNGKRAANIDGANHRRTEHTGR